MNNKKCSDRLHLCGRNDTLTKYCYIECFQIIPSRVRRSRSAHKAQRFEQSLLQTLLTYLIRLNVKHLFTILKIFPLLEVFRNFNGVKLPRQAKISCHELDTKQFIIKFVWANEYFNVLKYIIGFTRVSFNCATNFITFALFL